MKAKPLAQFRVRPSQGKLYFDCFIWRSLRDFRATNPGNWNALGLCRGETIMCYEPCATERIHPKLGEIHLVRNYLTMGIITHESTHAALRWSERSRCHPSLTRKHERRNHSVMAQNDPEERFCHALGNIARQIVWHLNRRKILK